MEYQDQKDIEGKKYTLYTYFRSSTSWRVRIALNYKKIQYDCKFINLLKDEQSSPQFLKVNPNGGVPALLVKTGQVLVQSMAICQFLEQMHAEFPLLPHDPVRKAQVRGFCEVINSGMHPYQNLRLLKKVNQKFGADKMQFAKQWVVRGMQTLEQFLKKTKGKYCFGDDITLADAFFYPQVSGGIMRFGVNIQEYPNCKEVFNNLQQIQAFVKAEPKNQPDFTP